MKKSPAPAVDINYFITVICVFYGLERVKFQVEARIN